MLGSPNQCHSMQTRPDQEHSTTEGIMSIVPGCAESPSSPPYRWAIPVQPDDGRTHLVRTRPTTTLRMDASA